MSGAVIQALSTLRTHRRYRIQKIHIIAKNQNQDSVWTGFPPSIKKDDHVCSVCSGLMNWHYDPSLIHPDGRPMGGKARHWLLTSQSAASWGGLASTLSESAGNKRRLFCPRSFSGNAIINAALRGSWKYWDLCSFFFFFSPLHWRSKLDGISCQLWAILEASRQVRFIRIGLPFNPFLIHFPPNPSIVFFSILPPSNSCSSHKQTLFFSLLSRSIYGCCAVREKKKD